jgi:hypothetical protein
VSTLARPGKSISWAADQILRSNIKANDIVVWGLTGERRFSYWQENQIHTYTINHRQQPFQHFILSPSQLDKFIADDNMIYQAVTQIGQVVNFCQKTQSKLLILGLLESPEIDMALGNTTEFVKYINLESPSTLVDLGTDNEHPGPQQHQLYADFCHSALQKLNYI